MSYQVLARKWRPGNFSELVGQEHVQRALINALDNDRLHHAYLFTGTRGVGKTTIARIFAKSLNCEEGVSSTPCGKCSACEAINKGRFLDLIEVDAASRTKVEDTRDLLDNVQYAPTQGRYKVYLIDEVHMLSGHSFNALLKTLEEPPPHVKFLLATTDPQKLPVTVLSRCLQFNLKSLSIPEITGQLDTILAAEKIKAEEGAIRLLAFAAEGSLRDALSLLDQAIAYGNGDLNEADVAAMLGTLDRDVIYRLLELLAGDDAAGILQEVAKLHEFAPDYQALLADIISALQRIAIAQALPEAIDDTFGDKEHILSLADKLSAEDAQLFYQVGLIGRRDLPLSPEPRGGFEMVMLRMLAFQPARSAQSTGAVKKNPIHRITADTQPSRQVTTKKAVATPVAKQQPKTASAPAKLPDTSEWTEIIDRLSLRGIIRELALNCVFHGVNNEIVSLSLDPGHIHLLNKQRVDQLESALRDFYGQSVKLRISREDEVKHETPARKQNRELEEVQQQAVNSIETDKNVKALEDTFGATVSHESIRPRGA